MTGKHHHAGLPLHSFMLPVSSLEAFEFVTSGQPAIKGCLGEVSDT
jgi:hypothetical protein